MNIITKIHIDLDAKDDHSALKLLQNLLKQLEADSAPFNTNQFLKTGYSDFKNYGNINAEIHYEQVSWDFT